MTTRRQHRQNAQRRVEQRQAQQRRQEREKQRATANHRRHLKEQRLRELMSRTHDADQPSYSSRKLGRLASDSRRDEMPPIVRTKR